MSDSRRKRVSRRDLLGSLFGKGKETNEPDPEEATLSVHSQERVQELLARLKEKNPAPAHTMPRQKPEETE